VLLSGFLFPIANMPVWIQAITYIDPLRYILIIIRSIFLKGIGFNILWPEMLSLFLLGVFCLFLSSRRFQKSVG